MFGKLVLTSHVHVTLERLLYKENKSLLLTEGICDTSMFYSLGVCVEIYISETCCFTSTHIHSQR